MFNLSVETGTPGIFIPILSTILLLDSETDFGDQKNISYKKFTITLSIEEWKEIKPVQVRYNQVTDTRPGSSRPYWVLPKGKWPSILAEHFWMHTKLPCCLAFKRSKVYEDGENYITTIGKCSICRSHFDGYISDKPANDSK